MYAKKDNIIDNSNEAVINDLKASTHLNMSQIYLFQKKFEKVINSCTKSLEIKLSVKGLYRRAIAYIEFNDLDKAKSDLKKIEDFELNNSEVSKLWEVIKEKEKLFDKELSQKMKKMWN